MTKEDLFDLINYVIREPEVDEHKPAYKYPFNAADVLSGENTYLLDKFFEDSNTFEEDRYEELDEEQPQREKEEESVLEKKCEDDLQLQLQQNVDSAGDTKGLINEISEVVEKIQNIEIRNGDDKLENDEETKVDTVDTDAVKKTTQTEELKLEDFSNIDINASNNNFELKHFEENKIEAETEYLQVQVHANAQEKLDEAVENINTVVDGSNSVNNTENANPQQDDSNTKINDVVEFEQLQNKTEKVFNYL